MFAPANFYSLNHYLKSEKPDIMMINETWHVEDSRTSLPDRQYSFLFSPADGVKAEGVGIIYRHPLIVVPMFKEFHNKNLIIARISSSCREPLILLSVYIPPSQPRREEAIAHLVRVVEFLHQRYSSFSRSKRRSCRQSTLFRGTQSFATIISMRSQDSSV
jgi:exonuclease III